MAIGSIDRREYLSVEHRMQKFGYDESGPSHGIVEMMSKGGKAVIVDILDVLVWNVNVGDIFAKQSLAGEIGNRDLTI